VPRTHQLKRTAGAVERTHEAVDAVAGVTVDSFDTPLAETVQQEITDVVAHRSLLSGDAGSRPWRCEGKAMSRVRRNAIDEWNPSCAARR